MKTLKKVLSLVLLESGTINAAGISIAAKSGLGFAPLASFIPFTFCTATS